MTGVIGAITGVAGMIMGGVSLRRTVQLKSLDLRLNLRYAESDLRITVRDLPPLLKRARDSHTRVAAATGLLGSGALKQWLADWEADLAAVTSLEAQLSDPRADYRSLKHAALEAQLVAVHALQREAARLLEKYGAAIAADDKEREQRRADLRITNAAKLQGRE